MAWLDYKKIKSQISVLDVIRHFAPNHELKQKGYQCSSVCILPGHGGDRDNPSAFQANAQKNCWSCKTHCGGGNVIDLWSLFSSRNPKNKADFRTSAEEMWKTFGRKSHDREVGRKLIRGARDSKQLAKMVPVESGDDLTEDEAKTAKFEYRLENSPLNFKLQVKGDHSFLEEDKSVPLEVSIYFGAGWTAKGMFAGRVVIPVHDGNGDLVAYCGRGIRQRDVEVKGRWLFPSNFHKSLELYNQHRLQDYGDLSKGLVVVESPWSVMRLYQAGIPAVALMGCEMSIPQEERLIKISDRIILALDNDPAGIKGARQILSRLVRRSFVKVMVYPDDDERTQPEAFTPDELKGLIYGE